MENKSEQIDTPAPQPTVGASKQELKPNMCFLYAYALALGVGVLQTTMVFTANTQTTPIFQAKFGWTEAETKFNNTIITTSGVIGMALGSVFGGKTITIGRRKATIITQTIGLVGGLLT